MRPTDALMRIPPIGISHPVAETLFDDALAALEDVGRFNDVLFAELDVDRFFYSVWPPMFSSPTTEAQGFRSIEGCPLWRWHMSYMSSKRCVTCSSHSFCGRPACTGLQS